MRVHPNQLELFSPVESKKEPGSENRTESHRRRISGYLSMRLPEPVDLVFTENRTTMLSFRSRRGRLSVRLHRLFRHAEGEVLEALARFILSKDEHASAVIDSFVNQNRGEIREAARRKVSAGEVRTAGEHHDLAAALSRVNAKYFGDKVEVGITWGRAPRRRARRRTRTASRALATYSYDDRMIRVSPVLDGADVPEFVVDWVIYHEVLHHVLPVERSGGRNRYHTRRFRALERAFTDYEAAKRWERHNLERLLR